MIPPPQTRARQREHIDCSTNLQHVRFVCFAAFPRMTWSRDPSAVGGADESRWGLVAWQLLNSLPHPEVVNHCAKWMACQWRSEELWTHGFADVW